MKIILSVFLLICFYKEIEQSTELREYLLELVKKKEIEDIAINLFLSIGVFRNQILNPKERAEKYVKLEKNIEGC